jgi:hypothetical protein
MQKKLRLKKLKKSSKSIKLLSKSSLQEKTRYKPHTSRFRLREKHKEI